jgi:hypothetical protein
MTHSQNRWACEKYEFHEKEHKQKKIKNRIARRIYLAFFASASIILYSVGLIYALDNTGRFKGPIGSTIDYTARTVADAGVAPIIIALIMLTGGLLITRLMIFYEDSSR